MTAFRSPLNLALLAALLLATAIGFLTIGADEVLPVRWGFDLSATETAPRNSALLQMPLGALLIWGVCWAFLRYGNAERSARNSRTVELVLPVVTALFLAVQAIILYHGMR